jgi:hypothetical protein
MSGSRLDDDARSWFGGASSILAVVTEPLSSRIGPTGGISDPGDGGTHRPVNLDQSRSGHGAGRSSPTSPEGTAPDHGRYLKPALGLQLPAPPDDRSGAARRRILRALHTVDGRAPSALSYRVTAPTDTVAFHHAMGVRSVAYGTYEGAPAPSP